MTPGLLPLFFYFHSIDELIFLLNLFLIESTSLFKKVMFLFPLAINSD
jgi:hypothetical protein